MAQKRKRISRIQKYHGPDEEAAIAEYARLLGEASWAWAQLHQKYGFIFESIVGDEDRTLIGHVIWTSVSSERTQRDILLNVLKWGYEPRVTMKRQIVWSLGIANKLSLYRNDMIHSPTSFLHDEDGLRTMPSHFGTPINRLIRLSDTNTNQLLACLRDDLIDLSEYTVTVWRIGHGTQSGPSPRKPEQRTFRLFHNESVKKPHRKSNAPKTRRGSLRA